MSKAATTPHISNFGSFATEEMRYLADKDGFIPVIGAPYPGDLSELSPEDAEWEVDNWEAKCHIGSALIEVAEAKIIEWQSAIPGSEATA